MAHEFDQPFAAEIVLHQVPIALHIVEAFARDREKTVFQQIGFGKLQPAIVERLEKLEGVIFILHVDADDEHAAVEAFDDRVGEAF